MTETPAEHIYRGTSVTGGIAIGPLFRCDTARQDHTLRNDLDQALEVAVSALTSLMEGVDEDAAEILEFQLALLEDDDLLDPVRQTVAAGTPADTAWEQAVNAEIAEYRDGDDAVFAARASDLEDMRDRVLAALYGHTVEDDAVPDGSILIAQDITPSRFLGFEWARLGGLALRDGSPTSHVSILARARGIPLLVGVSGLDDVQSGTAGILDLSENTLVTSPTAQRLTIAETARTKLQALDAEVALTRNEPALTRDGTRIEVLVNIDAPESLEGLSPDCCDGVGLTRTEFLFQQGAPGEEAQLAFYRKLVDWADGRPVTIRTLDAGGDKPLAGITVDGESNPFLGVRGVRLSLRNPDLFRVQIRALLRCAALGPIKVMVPMVTEPAELTAVRDLFMAEHADLQAKGVVCALPPIGMMIEVPSAALMASHFETAFYSIGSNDLIQYTTASARDNAAVAELARPTSPAVLALIEATLQAGVEKAVPVSLCGDMASSPELVPVLLRSGLRVFSCAPAQVGLVKKAIREVDLGSNAP